MNPFSRIVRGLALPVAAAVLLLSAAVTGDFAFAQSTAQPSLSPTPDVPNFAPVAPAASPAQPAGQTPIVLGILDVDQLLNQSSAGKSIRGQIDAAQKALSADVQKQDTALRASAQQLEQQRATLSQADFAAKSVALKAQEDKLRQYIDQRQQALGTSIDKARQALLGVMQTAVSQVQQRRGLTLILNKATGVVTSAPGWDITPEVMQRLNKALPNLKL